MKSYESGNVTLIEEDGGELSIYVQDPSTPLSLQELAILPEEIDRLMDVFMQYHMGSPQGRIANSDTIKIGIAS